MGDDWLWGDMDFQVDLLFLDSKSSAMDLDSTTNLNVVPSPLPLAPPTVITATTAPTSSDAAAKRRKVTAGNKFVATCTPSTTPVLSALELARSGPATATKSRKSSGALTLRRVKPIKSHIPYEIWLDIFTFCTPSQLASLRRVNSAFKNFIDDERVWAKSRATTFPNFPEPVFGYPERYMWNLWRGIGCMICGSARVRKVYWTWAVRLCFDCFRDGKVKSDELVGDHEFVQHARNCLRHCFVSGKSVTTERDVYYGGEPAYWKDEVEAFRVKYQEKKAAEANTPGVLAVFLQFEKDKVAEQMRAASALQKFERKEANARRDELAEYRKQRNMSIPERCKTDFEPPISEDALILMPSYLAALRSGSAFTERSWKTLARKLMAERETAERRHESNQLQKKRMYENVLAKKRALKGKGCQDQKNLQVVCTAMPSLLKQAKNFVRREAGQLFLEHSKSPSFILEALGYVRREWYKRHPDEKLVLRAVNFLWENMFEEMIPSRDMDFTCRVCGRTGKFQDLFYHIADSHSLDEQIVQLNWTKPQIEFVDGNKAIEKPPVIDWDGAEWPEVLPVLPIGPKFTPLVLRHHPSGSNPYAVAKKSKGAKGATVPTHGPDRYEASKPPNTLREAVERSIRLVKGVEVPPIFKLVLFLHKILDEEPYSQPRLSFNYLYYEISRLTDKNDLGFFKNEHIFCRYCIENKIQTEGHPGNGSFLQLMDHFCQDHYAVSDFEDEGGPLDWKKDMLLSPGPVDVIKMWTALDKNVEGRRWDKLAEGMGLDSNSCNSAIEEAKATGKVLLSMDDWAYTRVWPGMDGSKGNDNHGGYLTPYDCDEMDFDIDMGEDEEIGDQGLAILAELAFGEFGNTLL